MGLVQLGVHQTDSEGEELIQRKMAPTGEQDCNGGSGKRSRVMVAIDDSECSRHALRWALENLRHSLPSSSSSVCPLVIYTAQSTSILSHVPASAYGPARVFTAMSATPELIKSLREHQEKDSQALLERAKHLCTEWGVRAETITEVGEAREAICKAVDDLGIDLLILGSHGRGALQRALLGSVSNYCVHKAKCAVLVVKKEAH